MGCNKKKIFSIQDRLDKIARLKRAIEQIKLKDQDMDTGSIKLSNAKYENKVQNVEGNIRRSIRVQGDDIIPVKKNPNTINNVPDNLDSSRLNSPRLKPGDLVDVQFIENDYWANIKDDVEEL